MNPRSSPATSETAMDTTNEFESLMMSLSCDVEQCGHPSVCTRQTSQKCCPLLGLQASLAVVATILLT